MAIDLLSGQQIFGAKAESITNGAMILSLLKRMQENGSQLSVTIPGYEDSYASAILRIHSEQRYMLLDEMQPSEGHARFLREGKMRIRARLKGVDVRFTGELREAGTEKGIAFYNIPFPDIIYYGQRRNHYRAYVGSAGMLIPVSLLNENNKEIAKGPLLDISAGGLSTLLKSDSAVEFQPEEIVPHCTISLPTDQKIEICLEVRGLRSTSQKTHYRLGARFVNLDGPQQKVIEQFVAYIDRRSRKQTIKE
jgi:flagellar brake protein